MDFNIKILNFLNLAPETDDETASIKLTALITSAIHDEKPKYSLAEVYHEITKSSASSLLDPLHLIPLLIQSHDPASNDFIALIRECSSAKEVIIAVQEAIERLKNTLEAGNETDDESDDETVSSVETLNVLIETYTIAIPRIKLRKKSALETMRSCIEELQHVIDYAGRRATRDEGRHMISVVSRMADILNQWVLNNSTEGGGQTQDGQRLLRNLLSHTISICSHSIQSFIAQRAFEGLYPRLTIRSSIIPEWEEGEKVMSEAIRSYTSLGESFDDIAQDPSPSSLLMLAHSSTDQLSQPPVLLRFLPVIIASIQTSSTLDESLSVLLNALHRIRSDPSLASQLSQESIIPLFIVLPPLASGHPDPDVRHQAFRILSLSLQLSPPSLRMQILTDLTSDSEFPQMRVASVGLVKEAMLDALSSSTVNVFSSSMFLRVFGPRLFRPNPVDLFSTGVSLQEFQDSQEPQRLVECLSLYYVLLLRDQKNLTGIHDKDVILSIEHGLLSPLRSQLDTWMADSSATRGHPPDIMPLVSLKMGLERVDSAMANLK